MNATKLTLIAVLAMVTMTLGTATSWSQAGSEREALRQFYTAPPAIPHEVADQTGGTCLMCHTDVIQLGDRVSVPTPHVEYSNCLQCHVTVASYDGSASPPIVNDWVGLAEPRDGERIGAGAPPTIPHRLLLRENCLSCHHPEHPNLELRCDHPERSNCMQCHVAAEDNEFDWEHTS